MYERVAYLPEEPHYHLYLTVEEAVRYYASLYREAFPEARVQAAIEQVGLAEHRRLLLRKCSKGMKQKVGIAACLVKRPNVIFLDEPMRGLDPSTVKFFRDVLLGMNGEGTTVIVNTHILAEVEMMCSKAAIVQRGRVIKQDRIENLVGKDSEHYIVELDSVDSLPEIAELEERHDGHLVVRVPASQMAEFFGWAAARSVKVHSCALKKTSLKEAFFKALEEEA
jgi:ABC-2 type transport system ATP-binding protein